MKTTMKPIAAAILTLTSSAVLADGALSGQIRDANSALPGATIQVNGTDITTATDYQGQFEIKRLPAGEYQIEVDYLGYQSKTFSVSVTDDIDNDLGVLTLNVDEQSMEEVVAIGHMRSGMMRALNIQKESNNIMSVISADGIGKLPDRNAAEAVQRVAGVSIERDQGEGRFVAVRGLPSQWNSASINGDRLPTAEEETTSRAVAFDFFPTDMIEMVEVSKALTPDMEGDAIGGNVNFITRRAPDEQVLSVNVAAGTAEKAEGNSHSINLLYGDRSEDGKFGFLINGTVWERDWATDNYEPRREIRNVAGEGQPANNVAGVHRLELRDYTGTRTTHGLNASAEYLLDDGLVYAKAMYGSLQDEETHYKHRVRYNKGRVELQHIYDELITEMTGFQIGGEHDLSIDTSIDWSLATYNNEFYYGDIPNAEDKAYYVVKFKQSVEFDEQIGDLNGADLGNDKKLVYNEIDGGTDPALAIGMHLPDDWVMDPTKAVLADVELYGIDIQEKDNIVAQFDLTHTLSDELELKAGFKYRDKERSARFHDKFYEWNEDEYGATPTLAKVADEIGVELVDQPGRKDYLDNFAVDYQKHFSKVIPVNALKGWYDNNKHKLSLLEGDSEILENGGGLNRNFDLTESHTSIYGMATYTPSDKYKVVGGLRVTQTKTDVNGYIYLSDEDKVEQEKGGKDYTAILPSLHLTYSPSELTNYRLALTRSFARPDFGNLSPGATYLEIENRLTSGNPELNPTYSNNLDLMAEHFFSDGGVISAGYFYKQISDPIFNDSYQGSYRNQSVTVKSPLNGEDAWLHGIEFAIDSDLAFIGDWAHDFGVAFNFTVMDSEMSIPDRADKVAISRQADELYNAAIYYDNGSFASRIAVNHKGAFIEEHGDSADLDTYYGEYTSVDATASYYINDDAMVYVELNNLTDEPLQYYTGNEQRPNQIEYYGVRGQIGIKYDFF